MTTLLCLLLGLGLAPASASAALTLDKSAPPRVLLGDESTVTLDATNDASGPYGYNLSFRDVLPAGVSYVPGSARFGTDPLTPTVIADAPNPGETTLIFSNVADISVNSTQSISYRVAHAATGPGAFAIGESYVNEATAYANSLHRIVPGFTDAGAALGSPTGLTSNDDTASTQVSAIKIEKSEPNSEGEIMRGVHDHQTVYTLRVTNNGIHPTTGIAVDDYLPAGLEFLGCGTVDNTTSAATNLGSTNEYPGSGAIDAPGNAPADLNGSACSTPSLVETVVTDPDGSGSENPLPEAVYTHVRWTGLGSLDPGETIEIQYVAAVPLRENTVDWSTDSATTGGAVPATDGAQTANLDNNSGPETGDEQVLANHAIASGVYRGDDPNPAVRVDVEDATTLTRTAEDLAVVKSVDPGEIVQAGISEWTLDFRTSEYRRVTGGVVTDTLPNGLCPLGSTNYEQTPPSANAECDPVPGEEPSLDYETVTENADGTWTIVWNLPELEPSADYPVSFPTRTRRYYQDNFADDTANPVRAGDAWTNDVGVTATEHRICGDGDADCTGTPATPIDGDGPDASSVVDASAATQRSGGISIDKTVLDPSAIGDPVPVDCAAAQTADPNAYVDAPTVPAYGPGDRVCWRLRVDFSSTVDTGEPDIRDYLPVGFSYEPGSATPTSRNTLAGLAVNDSAAADGLLSWDLNDVDTADQVFEWTFATTVEPEAIEVDAEQTVTGNLMKLAYRNTDGETFSLRDRVEAEIVKPVVDLVKDVTSVTPGGGASISGGNASNVPVGSAVSYRVRLSNSGVEDAQRTVVWDDLPAGISCTDVVPASISDGGTCAPIPLTSRSRITWDPGVVVPGEGTKDLTYAVTVPQGLPPVASLANTAGVVEYERDTNSGGSETFVPEDNIDATREPDANAPRADDPATVTLRDVAVDKSVVTTSVVEPGNNAGSQATIGETIDYRIDVTVPAGQTLHGTPTLTDAVNARMQLLPGATVTQTAGATPTPSAPTLVDAGNGLILSFAGPYVNSGTEDAVFTVRFSARVRDVTTPANANRRGQTLPNSANFTWERSATDTTTVTRSDAAPNVTIVEPNLTVGKVAALTSNLTLQTSTVSAGDGVRYTVYPRNASGTNVAASHETVTVDTVPVGITPRKTDGTPVTATGDQVGISGYPIGTWNATARTITWSHGTLAPGADPIMVYEADVDSPAPAGLVLTNSATVTGTSLDGSDANERTATSGFNTGYTATATKALTVEGGTLTKTAVSPRATVGDLIDYTVEYTLPPDVVFYDLTFIDDLPDGVEYVPGSAQTTCVATPSCTFTGTAAAPQVLTEPRNPTTGVQRVAWFLDDIASSTEPRTVRLTYQGRISSAYAAISATDPVSAGDVLTNAVSTYYNATDEESAPLGSFPDPASYDDATGPETASTTVREPQLTLDKHVSGIPTGDDSDRRDTEPGDSYTYTLTVTNDGDSPAYDVDVTDTPSDKLTNVVATAGGVSPSGTATVVDGDGDDGSLAWTIPGPLDPGDAVTLTYTADLVESSELSANETVVNTATVPSYWNASEAERTADPDDGFREYTADPPTDTVTLDVRLPNVTVQKTTGGSGFPEAADAEIGESFPWRIVITNPSPSSTAHDVSVTDVLPAGWSYDADSASFAPVPGVPGFDPEPTVTAPGSGDTLSWSDIGDIAPGGQVVLTFTATPDLASKPNPNPQVNAVDVTAEDSDGQSASADGPYVDDDSADANLQLPELDVDKTPDAGSATAGTTESYTVVVRNTSTTAPARDVEVTDVLEAHQTYTAGTATAVPSTGFSETTPVVDDNGTPGDETDDTTTIGWTIDEIPADSQVTITVPVAIADDLAAGTTLENDVSVVSREITTAVTDGGSFTTDVDSDVEVEKTIVSPTGSLVPGETVTYEITATNNGPSVATGVTVADELPETLTIGGAPSGCSVNRQEIECPVGTLAVGASETFTFTATIDPSATGTLANTATVTSTTPDSDTDNNTSTASRGLAPLADLEVTKTVSDASLDQGDEFTYEIEVRNDGPSDAVGVTLSDVLPSPDVVLAATVPTTDAGTCTPVPATNTVNCALGTLEPDDTVTVTITAQAVGVGTFTNVATAATTTPESSTANNSDDVDVTIAPVANVGIEKTAPATVAANGTLTYTLRLFNDGPSPATGVTVTDELPEGVELVSASAGCTEAGGTVTCTVGALPVSTDPSSDPTVTITVRAPWDLAEETLSNTASITANELDRTPGDDESTATTDVGPAANLRTTKTAPALPVPQTVPYEYEVTIENTGPSTAVDVELDDPMPTGVTALDAETADGTCTVTPTAVSCELGDLAVGGSATVTITARGDLPGTPTNTATATSTTPEVDPSDDADDAEVTILAASDVGVVKSAPETVDANQTLTYRLAITNHGPSDATGVTVTDALPDGLELRSASAGCTASDRTVVCAVGDLASGDTVEREIEVFVPFALGGQTLTNIASVTANEVDLDPGNDSSQAVTTVDEAADLVVAKTAGGAVAGGYALWTVTVSNAGPTAARDVTLRDVLPGGTVFHAVRTSAGRCEGAGQTVDCAFGRLEAGGSVQVSIAAVVGSGTTGQLLRNVAAAASPTPDPNPDNNAARADVVVAPAPPTSPDLRVSKVASTSTPELGRPLTYRIAVTNVGGLTATDVRMTDTMNRAARITRAITPQGECTIEDGSALDCTLGAIAPGQTVTVDVRVTPESVGELDNTVSVLAAGQPEQRIENNEAVAGVRVEARRTTVSLRKRASDREVRGGRQVTFTITAKMGKHAGHDVEVCDRLPRGLTFVRASGARFSRGQACWTVDYLPAGKTKRFRIVARTERSDRTRSIRNTAVVRADNVRRRTASATVRVAPALAARAGGVAG